MGERGLLLEFESLDHVLAAAAALTGPDRPSWVQDVVPAARTLLVLGDGAGDRAAEVRALLPGDAKARPSASGREADVVMTVSYTGPDLELAALHARCSVAELIDWHTRLPWRIAFGGFAPGFAYLDRPEAPASFPRRDTPRPAVPAGSVALAGEFSAVYPRESPGGWLLIGHSDAPLWELDRQPPALLVPGGRVHFRADETAR